MTCEQTHSTLVRLRLGQASVLGRSLGMRAAIRRLERGGYLALLQVVHWLVNGIPRCGEQELNPAGVTVSHSFDTNQLHVNCGLCCAYLVNETMGEELRGRLRSEWGETVREMLKARDEG